MEWYLLLLLFIGGLLFTLFLGVPLAAAFLVVNFFIIGMLMDFGPGSQVMVVAIYNTLSKFILVPIPLFVLLGELLLRSGLALRALDAISLWIGKVPGRLSLLTIGGGAVFSTLTGSTMATSAVLGQILGKEMRRRNYSISMTYGPIAAAGGLAWLIPPSHMGVLLAAVAEVSVAKVLIAGILPGFLLAALYGLYILIRCWLNPSLAPVYTLERVPSTSEKLVILFRDILPVLAIIFFVVGVILLGVATPTEAAAFGVVGAFLLVVIYRRLRWEMLKECMVNTVRISGIVLFIVVGSSSFGQLLAFSGTSQAFVRFLVDQPLPDWMILAFTQLSVILLGMFLDQAGIIMLVVPLFMPLVYALNFDPILFCILTLISLEIGLTTPPMGINLFVIKGIATPDVTMRDIYQSAVPFILIDILALVLIAGFPAIATWLPTVSGG